VTALQGTGPFTVFAPTDAAFTAALTALGITKQQLLDRADLADILKYHVISGSKIMAADLQATQTPTTLEGQTVTITKNGAGVKFATATVTGADVDCSNGVIHVIDAVVLPPTPVDIVATALATGNHGVLAEALTKANLVTALQGTGPFTVFAPTDAAFTAALTALGITKQQLLDRADLADILKYHVISGSKIMAADLQATQTPTTLEGQNVTITKNGAVVKFATATVTAADVGCSNGLIHVINAVVLPPAASAASSGSSGGNISSGYRTAGVASFACLVIAVLFGF
jgi:transforming growth factor-beta-induced protein